MANKYIALVLGKLKQIEALVVSAGAGDAGKIIALDANGKLDNSVLPTGMGAETTAVLTSEILAAGDWVNVYDNAGTPNVRKADASDPAKYCNGFVLAGFGSAVLATVYTEGINNQVSGMDAGTVYLSAASPGDGDNTPPAGSGDIVQIIGEALSATEVSFEPQLTVELV
jgi:hypothetical protein